VAVIAMAVIAAAATAIVERMNISPENGPKRSANVQAAVSAVNAISVRSKYHPPGGQ
jgi:hypothetical protein